MGAKISGNTEEVGDKRCSGYAPQEEQDFRRTSRSRITLAEVLYQEISSCQIGRCYIKLLMRRSACRHHAREAGFCIYLVEDGEVGIFTPARWEINAAITVA